MIVRRAAAVAVIAVLPFGGTASAEGPVEDAKQIVIDLAREFAPTVKAVRDQVEQVEPPSQQEVMESVRDALRDQGITDAVRCVATGDCA